MFDVPVILRDWLGDSPRVLVALYGAFGFFIAIVLLVLWLAFGSGPKRRRAMSRARRLLRDGEWADALASVPSVRRLGGSARWRRRLDEFEAECQGVGAAAALHVRDFEKALEHSTKAAHLLGRDELEVRLNIQSAMLREVRRLFSVPGETRATVDLIARTLLVQSPCREASFWQALCDLRSGQSDQALVNLEIARTGQARSIGFDAGLAEPAAPPSAPASPFLDPPLYLGSVLMLRMGQPKEALRYLTEANRLDPGCPFVTLQLGAAMIAVGGDTQLAVRALQRALGPRGLGQWEQEPQRAWAAGLPEHRSYIRKLAGEFPFTCPLWGSDLIQLRRQGHLALAQGQFRLGNFPEAAQLFELALKEGAPSLTVLRGLGLSLAKLGRYDDAFKHLLTAHDMEEVKDRLTAGYLALCGACGTPTSAQDRVNNIAWALRTVQQWSAPGDAEWVGLLNAIFAQARSHASALSADDQLYLCEHLLSVNAIDPVSADAYVHLMTTFPRVVHPEYAFLFCRADAPHSAAPNPQVLDLYALTFARREAAESFYAARQWDFAAVEYAYLARAAQLAPGHFPAALGPDYPPRGAQLLLQRSEQEEHAGQLDAALATVEILVRLEPGNTRALDRAAALHYRADRLDRATELLEAWHTARPDDPLPLVRQAALLHQKGDEEACGTKIRQATALCTGARRARIAFLGARLQLQSSEPLAAARLTAAREFLEDCLVHAPGDLEALWCLAAVRWCAGDSQALATLTSAMDQSGAVDPRFHFLAAVCHLAAGEHERVLDACRRVRELSAGASRNGAPALDFVCESRYLAALAELALGRRAEAVADLDAVHAGPSAPLARALLGRTHFLDHNLKEASRCWQALDVKQRQAWGITEPLGQAVFAEAIAALHEGRFEPAAEQFRQAGRLGCRDRRLGHLLLLALFKAGQQAVYHSVLRHD